MMKRSDHSYFCRFVEMNPFATAFTTIVQSKKSNGSCEGGAYPSFQQNGPYQNHYQPRPVRSQQNTWNAPPLNPPLPFGYPHHVPYSTNQTIFQPPPPPYPQATVPIMTAFQHQYSAPSAGYPAHNNYYRQNAYVGPSYPSTTSSGIMNGFISPISNNHQPLVSKPTTSFYCSTCNKSLPNHIAYKAHCEMHVPCDHPGCSFSASRKVVSAHYHSTHGEYSGSGYKEINVEGQMFRVLCGTSPEEVAQWREERRNKFPTNAHIQAKQQNRDKLQDAGGFDVNRESGKKRGRKQHNNNHDDKNRDHRKNKRNKREQRDYYQPQPSSSNSNHPADNNDVDIDDDEDNHSINLSSNRHHKRLQKDPSNTNNSKLNKPDISGNLLTRLLAKEVVQDENLLLQSIRFLRQIYCCPPATSESSPPQEADDLVENNNLVVEDSEKNEVVEGLHNLLSCYASDDEQEDGECSES